MRRLSSVCFWLAVVLVALVMAGPTIVALVHTLVPLVLVIGITGVVVAVVSYLRRW